MTLYRGKLETYHGKLETVEAFHYEAALETMDSNILFQIG